MTHLENLEQNIPGLIQKKMLDLGSGRGKFLVEVTKRGGDIQGFEKNPEYIEMSHERARAAGVNIRVESGVGEQLPFATGEFEFINMAEVLEHVEDPSAVIGEVFRVLSPGGVLYLSAPSRFGLKDPHFHLYGINWVPRAWSHAIIGLFGCHEGKEYDGRAGRQRLDEMHYFTRARIFTFLEESGFEVRDTREVKIQKMLGGGLLARAGCFAYRGIGELLFDTFHLLATKR